MANKLVKALKRMLKMHNLMMTKIDHATTAWDAECITEMNEAPGQARAALEEYQELEVRLREEIAGELKEEDDGKSS